MRMIALHAYILHFIAWDCVYDAFISVDLVWMSWFVGWCIVLLYCRWWSCFSNITIMPRYSVCWVEESIFCHAFCELDVEKLVFTVFSVQQLFSHNQQPREFYKNNLNRISVLSCPRMNILEYMIYQTIYNVYY